MDRLTYSREEILAEPPYARRQVEAGLQLHGGFDAKGEYLSPRTLFRWPAVKAWQAELAKRGYPLVDASVKLLKRGNYPSTVQQRFLLQQGLGQTLWDGLTITGIIEAKGRALCDVAAPDFQKIIVEDLSGTATGHLNQGLLHAHGLDEGGNPEGGEGGHDAMWFAVRDVLFGKNAYPIPTVPESLSRPESGRRMPVIPAEYENWILLLMNVLMIEVRAESFFAFCTAVMRDSGNFTDRRPEAMHAAEIVERIRTDESIHVAYLQTFVSELRSFTFKADSGAHVAGHTLIDPVWEDMTQWHGETNADFARAQTRDDIETLFRARHDGAMLAAQFDALEFKEAAE